MKVQMEMCDYLLYYRLRLLSFNWGAGMSFTNSLFSVGLHLTNTRTLLMEAHLFAKSNQTHLWFVWDHEASFFWLVVGIGVVH